MKKLGRYDSDAQMFVEEPKQLDESHIRFMRWLAENGRLEHPVAGPSSNVMSEPAIPESAESHPQPQYTGRAA